MRRFALLPGALGLLLSCARPDAAEEELARSSDAPIASPPSTTPNALPPVTPASGLPPETLPSASASAIASAAPAVAEPRFLKENPKCAVPAGYPVWSWRRLHRVEGLADRSVILTLDVGAKLDNLEKVLDLLRAAEVRTTIFLYTAELERAPRGREIVERMMLDGHELANHTHSHRDLSGLEDKDVIEELDAVERFVRSVDERVTTMPFFREPYLGTNEAVDKLVLEHCYRSIWFTVDTGDWKAHVTAEDILRNVFERRGKPRTIESGSIFIFHGSQKENLVALPRAIERLKEQGFGFLTLGDALKRAGVSAAAPAGP